MKRFLLRLSALIAVVTVGLLAIAQAQRAAYSQATHFWTEEPGAEAVAHDDGAAAEPLSQDAESAPVETFTIGGQRHTATPPQEEFDVADPVSAARYDPARMTAGWPYRDVPGEAAEAARADDVPVHDDIPTADEVFGHDGDTIVRAQYLDDDPDDDIPSRAPPEIDPFDQRRGGRYAAGADDSRDEPAVLNDVVEDARPIDTYGARRESSTDAEDDPRYDSPSRPASPAAFDHPQPQAYDALDHAEEAYADDPRREDRYQNNHTADDTYSEGTGQPGSSDLEGPQSPSLVVEKLAPPELQVGQSAIFEIHVRNVGPVAADGVEIRDVVPRGARLISTNPRATRTADGQLSWSLGSLPAGEQTAVEIELLPLEEGEIGSVASVHFRADASVRSRVTRPQLAVEIDAPSQVMIGNELHLTIQVSNPGSGNAVGVVLFKKLSSSLTHPAGSDLEYEVGTLEPGESRTLELNLLAAEPGQLIESLSARAEGNLQATAEFETEIIAPALDVALDGPKRRFLEREAAYTVTVSNPGTASAHEVRLVTHLPPGLKFVTADNYGEYDAATRTVHWLLEELPPQQRGNVTLTAMPVTAGEQTLVIEGSAEQGLAVRKEEGILVEGVAAILFQVADVEDPIAVGGETVYEIRVVNQGTKAATNVRIEALLPPELRVLSADGPTRHAVESARVLFDPLPKLAPKADTTYQVRVEALQPGDARMRVRLMSDEISSPVTKEESTRVFGD